MPDVVDQLSRYATALADSIPAADIDDVRGLQRRRRSPRPLAAVAIAVVVVALVGAMVLWPTGDDASRVTSVDEGPTSIDESTSTTAAATRTLRSFPVAVVTPDEYLVWAGEAGDDEASVRADRVLRVRER